MRHEAALADRQLRLLIRHLRERCETIDCPDPELAVAVIAGLEIGRLPLGELSWERSAVFAHLIDGYRLCELAGLGDPFAYAERGLGLAQQSGIWEGTALELWVSLFLEHRRWRFADREPAPEQIRILDALCKRLATTLEETVP